MLEFNPKFRPSASDCLKSPIFDSIRGKDSQKLSTVKLHIKIDEIYDQYKKDKKDKSEFIQKCKEILLTYTSK